eukprot:TRINITY_DN15574_c0_g1_i1.p1 TRINITY_DN15574_c0_g1~~TRINITY_DN15574_c0_g1_i1.p1  ORF type:complete len:335 (+),score=65.03 TRINITY_DN15574_c0_g1_i1:147-1151(+)
MGDAGIPIGTLLPSELDHARTCAGAAVIADKAGDYETAVDLYKKAVKALLRSSEGCARRRDEVGGVREKVLVMAERYMKRVDELKGVIEAMVAEQKKEVDLEDVDANYYSESSDSYSEGERQTVSREKLTFKGAAELIIKLLRVPFGFKKLSDRKPQLTCKITKRDFLKLKDLTPLSSTAIKPLYEMGQPHVLWASYVLKRSTYHRRFAKTKIDRRTAVVSPQAFYMGASNELVRCVPIADIQEVIVGNDNWVGLRVPSQYDLMFQPQEQPIQSIATLIDILTVIYKYMKDEVLKVTRLNDTVDPASLVLGKPDKWEPTFTNLRVDPITGSGKS